MVKVVAFMNEEIPYFVNKKILNYVIQKFQSLVGKGFTAVNGSYSFADYIDVNYKMELGMASSMSSSGLASFLKDWIGVAFLVLCWMVGERS